MVRGSQLLSVNQPNQGRKGRENFKKKLRKKGYASPQQNAKDFISIFLKKIK